MLPQTIDPLRPPAGRRQEPTTPHANRPELALSQAVPFPDSLPLRGRKRTDYEEAVSQANEVFEHLQGGLDNLAVPFESADERREYLRDIAHAARSPHFGEAFALRIEELLGGAL